MNKTFQEIRCLHGMTQRELAQKIDVTGATIRQWESGSTIPMYEYRQSLTKVFQISTEELWNVLFFTAIIRGKDPTKVLERQEDEERKRQKGLLD